MLLTWRAVWYLIALAATLGFDVADAGVGVGAGADADVDADAGRILGFFATISSPARIGCVAHALRVGCRLEMSWSREDTSLGPKLQKAHLLWPDSELIVGLGYAGRIWPHANHALKRLSWYLDVSLWRIVA